MTTDKDNLIDLVSSVSGDTYLKVEENLGDGFVRLRVSEAERRQAKHDIRSFEDIVVELLRNARDAHAQRIFVATTRDGDIRSLAMIDDGVGVPDGMQERIFEPRVTSKLETMVMDRWGVHGRGMALFSVRSNVSKIAVAASGTHKGASIVVSSDSTVLSERADQSSWPAVEKDDSGILRVARGPHNVIRRVLEFACEHPEVDVFLGSPVEVL
ncbi:MAG: ATP-binding protein, partial [Coriobacteriia bacterium]|nr:ATP-binding protein [Coriobacteriia bacterium]